MPTARVGGTVSLAEEGIPRKVAAAGRLPRQGRVGLMPLWQVSKHYARHVRLRVPGFTAGTECG
jgi:hypothetical protein